MSHLLRSLAVLAAAALLVYAGFGVTGLLAGHVRPELIGLTGSTAFGPLMFAAWGLPAAAFWFAHGLFARQQHPIRLGLLGATVEAALLLSFALALPSNSEPSAELHATAVTLGWPVALISVLSPLGAYAGATLRKSRLSAQAQDPIA